MSFDSEVRIGARRTIVRTSESGHELDLEERGVRFTEDLALALSESTYNIG